MGTLAEPQSLDVARTVAVNMFVFGEMFYLFNCRSLESITVADRVVLQSLAIDWSDYDDWVAIVVHL